MNYRIRYARRTTVGASQYERYHDGQRENFTRASVLASQEALKDTMREGGLHGPRLRLFNWRVTERGHDDGGPQRKGFMRRPPNEDINDETIYAMIVTVDAVWLGDIPEEHPNPEHFDVIEVTEETPE